MIRAQKKVKIGEKEYILIDDSDYIKCYECVLKKMSCFTRVEWNGIFIDSPVLCNVFAIREGLTKGMCYFKESL